MSEPERHYSEQRKPGSEDPKGKSVSTSVWKNDAGSDSKRGFQNPGAHRRPSK